MANLRARFNEENFRELLCNGETVIDGITFILNGESGWSSVGVSDKNLSKMVDGDVTTSEGLHGLTVEYYLSDIGYELIYQIMSQYKNK